ncbi:MAG: HigA family addiction module antitoxin [Propionicimonas sp.]
MQVASAGRVREQQAVRTGHGVLGEMPPQRLAKVRRQAMTTVTPIHPGEILMEESLGPLEISQNRLAVAIGVPPRRINEIVHGKRRVTADTALRLARHFGTSDRFWPNLQTRFHLVTEAATSDSHEHLLEHLKVRSSDSC